MSNTKQVILTPQKLIISGIVLLALFTLTTLGIITFMLREKVPLASEVPKAHGIGPSYELDTFNVNLADLESKRFLRATLTLELSSSKLIPELDKRQAQIRDIIISILRKKKAADLKADSINVVNLKHQVKEQLNAILEKGEISAVYFTEFIVQ
ncbi:MAG: flagellar basal body-associated FliL family protein [bacterium]|jgi:flagellar basal body-associated protein FliL